MKKITTTLDKLTNIYERERERTKSDKELNYLVDQVRKEYTYIDKKLFNQNIKYKSLEELEKTLDSGRFNIDIDGIHFECLFNNKPKNNLLYVVFNGGRTDIKATPQFPRWSYSSLFNGSYLGIEDPMYYKYKNLKIGWYYGTKNKSYIEYCIVIIKSVCNRLNIPLKNVIFFSSSGGGYAGIYASTLINDSLSI